MYLHKLYMKIKIHKYVWRTVNRRFMCVEVRFGDSFAHTIIENKMFFFLNYFCVYVYIYEYSTAISSRV